MRLSYRIQIEEIPVNEGGGFLASIPLLGRYAVCSDGETVEQALRTLNEIKRERLAEYLEKGVFIPEPKDDDEAFKRTLKDQ